jgi:tRNA/tmRNA/rRNA uracil-C5-methylase (TrmA/RlmC/RlmD family)
MNDADQTAPLPETLELTIEKLVTGGAGLGRHNGQAIFVLGTAPGDRVRVRPAQHHRGYLEADLIELVSPGPGRQTPPCPHYDRCGGCDLQHLDDPTQRDACREILLDCFRRLGGLEVADRLEPDLAGPTLGYRNRLRLVANDIGHYGLQERGSNAIVPLQTCPIMAEPFLTVILPWLRQLPPMEQVVVRLDGRGGWLLSLYGNPARQRPLRKLLAETAGQDAPASGLQGLLFNNRPQWGRTYLVIHVGEHKFRVSHRSFFQSNLAAAAAVLAAVRGWLADCQPGGGDLADLYGGVGLFTLGLADRCERLLLVDSDLFALQDAQENLRRQPALAERAEVRQGNVDLVLAAPDIGETIAWPDASVVVDPPRAGLGKKVVAQLARLRPRTLVYLSCDPATLARDCAGLGAAGYRIERVRPVAMFPQTSHLETLVLLTRT